MTTILKTKLAYAFYISLLGNLQVSIQHRRNSRRRELELVCTVGTPDEEN